MSHTHHPNGAGPVCRFRTKKECDANWSAHQAAKIAAYEGRVATKVAEIKAARELAYLTYEQHERERIARGGPPC
jgi:hypothetical protein